ncbi:hypothetical protein L484_015786 [Morus notabilis]|uniref:Uncharacterized protein n=1 Tax=Morus notabilis TaxID=981085 RepID=W9RWT2_9ROSA|nr:hypothetical protein L484_015786 [Morus notabilis]
MRQIHKGKGKGNEIITIMSLDISHADVAATKIRSYGTLFLVVIFFFGVPLVYSGSSYEAFVRVREVRRNDILRLCCALLISMSLAAADTLPLEVAISSKQELYFHNYNALKSCV